MHGIRRTDDKVDGAYNRYALSVSTLLVI